MICTSSGYTFSGRQNACPEVTSSVETLMNGSKSQACRLYRPALDLVPGAWRRHRRAQPGTDGIGGRVSGPEFVPTGVDQDPAASIRLVELLGEALWIAVDQLPPHRVTETSHLAI